MPSKCDVVFIGPVVWGSVWGHGPELASYLSGGRRVAYLDPPVPPSPAKNSFIDRNSYSAPDNLEVVRRGSMLGPGAAYGLLMELKNLLAAIIRPGAALVTYYPAGSVLALIWCRLTGRRSLFVYADRPEIFSSRPARLAAKLLLGATAKLASAGCVATSAPLLDDLRNYTADCELIPNGVDLDRVTSSIVNSADSSDSKKFRVAFVGAFGEWVDFDLVLETAAACPWAQFELIGDGPLWETVTTRAEKLENVTLTGALPHTEVFSRLAEADVCLVPFKVNRLTDRVCPVKLFEYWALGKPVIATPCRELARLAGIAPEALHLAADSKAASRLLTAFRDNPETLTGSSAKALEAVKGFDWRLLGQRIEQKLFGPQT